MTVCAPPLLMHPFRQPPTHPGRPHRVAECSRVCNPRSRGKTGLLEKRSRSKFTDHRNSLIQVLILCFVAIQNFAGIVAFCVFFGIVNGTYVAIVSHYTVRLPLRACSATAKPVTPTVSGCYRESQ